MSFASSFSILSTQVAPRLHQAHQRERQLDTLLIGNLFHMPEYPPACWWDEWPEPRVPLGEAQMKYASKPVPEGAKFRNTPLLAAGIGILRVCHLLGVLSGN